MAASQNSISNFMELLHDHSLPTIELLQKSFPNNKDFMINISTLFDPRYVFLIYAPLLFALNRRVGHRMIIALCLAEWANQILKWLLAGERPYWYVHERAGELGLAANFSSPPSHELAQAPQLKQFPVTCELGAGSPSGHSMVTATVWYILIDAYLKGELLPLGRPDYFAGSIELQQTGGDKLAKLSWSLYTLMLLLVSLSRVYLACHFPHQCLAGALLGCLLAKLVAERLPMERLRTSHFCLATSLMFASVMATYFLLMATGFDPLWSVDKAMRWCVKKEYIHLDTTPFFSMMRYLGVCLGAGLAYDARRLLDSATLSPLQGPTGGPLLGRRLLAAAGSIAFGQLLLALPAPKSSLYLFYLISFALYTLFTFAIAGPIPQIAKWLLPATCRSARAPAARPKGLKVQ